MKAWKYIIKIELKIAALVWLCVSAWADPPSMVLTWRDNSDNEKGFEIQREDLGGEAWRTIAAVGANVETWTDSQVWFGGVFNYRVIAYNDETTSDPSNVATGKVIYSPTIVPVKIPDHIFPPIPIQAPNAATVD